MPLLECTATTSEDRVTQPGAPLATTADEVNTMRTARIAIATADLGSDGGVVDGRARVHWRDGAWFPASGDGSALFIIYVDLRRLTYVQCSKPCISAVAPLGGVNPVACGACYGGARTGYDNRRAAGRIWAALRPILRGFESI